MTVPFPIATRLEPISEGLFVADVPDGWQQGRGAFGGLVFGLLVRAGEAFERDPTRPLRSFSADIAGPVMPGPARVRVRALRRGKSQTNLQAELEQEGQVLAVANLIMAAQRKVDVRSPTVQPPEESSRPWSELAVAPVGPPYGPVFATHYEYRNVGSWPLSQSAEATSAGFVREQPAGRAATETLDASAITALLDTYWPALYAISPRPFAMTTISFVAQILHHGPPLPAHEPLFFRARALAESEGYCVEFRELWAREKLVALNQQTFAVLR